MVKDAVDVALRYHCSIYDAVFLTLAEALEAPLITADARFYNSLRDRVSNIVWIGEYTPTT